MVSHYKDKKVTVVGLARSGIAACNLLKDLGAEVFATDSANSHAVKAQAEELKKRGISVETGSHTIGFIRDKDLLVVSPGVNYSSQALLWASEFKIPVISEIELAWSLCPATVVAITGTNGKTTVTTLVAKVLEASGRKALALGNIGKPFSQEVMSLHNDDFVSLEVSSFQLEKISRFKPKASLILNFTPDHLDRYSTIQDYLDAKKRIFMNQDAHDYAVLNYDDPVVRVLAKEIKARVIFFGRQHTHYDAVLNLNPNHLAVMAVAEAFEVPREICYEVFRNFRGVEHRLELVRTIDTIDFINDSKATNVDSTIWALHNTMKPAILIAGGRDKKSDYKAIADLVKQKVRLLVVIGEAKEKISASFNGLLPIMKVSSLEEAVRVSFHKAQSGDCILLSPMCASFDMFKDYEHRGRVFKEIVNKLIVNSS